MEEELFSLEWTQFVAASIEIESTFWSLTQVAVDIVGSIAKKNKRSSRKEFDKLWQDKVAEEAGGVGRVYLAALTDDRHEPLPTQLEQQRDTQSIAREKLLCRCSMPMTSSFLIHFLSLSLLSYRTFINTKSCFFYFYQKPLESLAWVGIVVTILIVWKRERMKENCWYAQELEIIARRVVSGCVSLVVIKKAKREENSNNEDDNWRDGRNEGETKMNE